MSTEYSVLRSIELDFNPSFGWHGRPCFFVSSRKKLVCIVFFSRYNLKRSEHVNIHGMKAAIKKAEKRERNGKQKIQYRKEAHSHIMQ